MFGHKQEHNISVMIFSDESNKDFFRAFNQSIRIAKINSLNSKLNSSIQLLCDIVLIDCGSYFNKGIKLLKEIKKNEPSIPVIILTDVSNEFFAIQAFRTGARDYIPKPIKILKLQEIISNIVKIKRNTKEKRAPFLRSERRDYNANEYLANKVIPTSIHRVIDYIEDNISEKISLNECAKIAFISKYHFCRIFKKYMGISPMRYVMMRRMKMAKTLMHEPTKSLQEIALLVGIEDYGNFVRVFKNIHGMTPSEFRKHI